ncbi:MAG: division/cell wall cluster transcriptional repressor MraZ [Solobacterium sp.]|nr:division/cell wall cluster transcriptional repressor MraZ [Solobacterium sp.]
MFMGEYRHSLDSKNRVIIPARFRDELGDTFVITVGFDKCLTVYTSEQWAALTAKLNSMPFTDPEARMVRRRIMANAGEMTLDSQGRINLTNTLKKITGITSKCAVIGAGDHVEIWSEDLWDAYNNAADDAFETAAASLTEFLR